MPEITKIIQNKHAHPVIAEMLNPDVRNDLPPSECVPASSEGQSSHTATDESRAASNAISVSACIRSAVNVGYLRLMVQHPVQAQPVRAFLYRSTVLLTHGIPMAGLHAPGLHCIQW